MWNNVGRGGQRIERWLKTAASWRATCSLKMNDHLLQKRSENAMLELLNFVASLKIGYLLATFSAP